MKKRMQVLLIGLIMIVGAAVPILAQEAIDEPTPTEEVLVTDEVLPTEATASPSPTPTPELEETVEPPITNYPGGLDPSQTPTPENILNSLWVALVAALAPIAGSPIVSAVVQVLKNAKIQFLQNTDPRVINVAVSLLVVVLVFAANVAGFREQLDTAFQAIVALVGITVGAKASVAWYKGPASGLPFLGTERDNTKPLG